MNYLITTNMDLLHLNPKHRKRFKNMLKAIADIIIHFTIDELQELHDYVENMNTKHKS